MTVSGMGRPLTTLRRYSGICSTVSGVPWARRRIARLVMRNLQLELPNHAHYGLHVLNRSAGHDPMTKIEDVAGASGGGAQDFFHALLKDFHRSEKRDGVEVTLHRVGVSHGAPAFVEGLPPIETDDVCAGRGHFCEEAGGFHTKIDDRYTHGLHRANQALGGFEGIVAIVGQAERTNPTVKDLDNIGAGLDLLAAI